MSDFLTQGIPYLLPKGENRSDPAKYRPITCLCTLYKILTSCLTWAIYQLRKANILAEEQKHYTKNAQGCKERLIIDSVVMEQAAKKRRNIYTAFVHYKKAFVSISHSWLLLGLQLYKGDQAVVALLQGCYGVLFYKSLTMDKKYPSHPSLSWELFFRATAWAHCGFS